MSMHTGKWWICIALLGLVACGGDDPKPGKKKDGEPKNGAKILSVEVSPQELELEVGESRQLMVVVKGEGDFDPSVTWTSSDETVATVVDGLVEAIGVGLVTITATSDADATKSGTADLKIVHPPIAPSTLHVKLEGLPEGMKAGVKIEGPEGYEATVDEDRVLEDLQPGAYLATASTLEDETHRYHPMPATMELTLEENETAFLTIEYEAKNRFPFTLTSDGAVLPLFDSVDLFVTVDRSEDFEGAVELTVTNLPAGVTATSATIEAEHRLAHITLDSDGSVRELGKHEIVVQGVADGVTVSVDVPLSVEAVVTSMEDDGEGSLRHYLELLPELTSLDGGPIVITFPYDPDSDGEIYLSQPLVVTGEVVIQGPMDAGLPSIILQGNHSTQLLRVEKEAVVTIDAIVFQKGKENLGGAIYNEGSLTLVRGILAGNEGQVGGAIYNSGSLDIETTWFAVNEASMDGGAIFNAGSLRIHDALFRDNTAQTTGGAIRNAGDAAHLELSLTSFENNSAGSSGGAIYSKDATLRVEEECLFIENRANEGGALAISGGNTRINDAIVEENEAEGWGGGIWIQDRVEREFAEGEFTLEVLSSTIAGNQARNAGGGIFVTGARLRVVSSTIGRNIASDFSGGGIGLTDGGLLLIESSTVFENESNLGGGGIAAFGTVTVFNSTVAGNSAVNLGGGIALLEESSLELVQSTVAGNTAMAGGGLFSGGDVYIQRSIVATNSATAEGPEILQAEGSITTGGYNLFGDLEGADFLPLVTDITDQDPLLFDLDDYGGPTLTMGFDNESPAKDAIPESECLDLADEALTVDQRGELRPAGTGCDIGAFERQ